MRSVLTFVRDLQRAAVTAHASEYKAGYLDALDEVEEFLLDQAWEEGDDDTE